MFYKESDIVEELTCPKCRLKFDDPRILPCSESLCNECIGELTRQSTEFQCPFCPEKHQPPDGGFTPNKFIIKLLKKQPHEVNRGKSVRELKELLEQINEKNEQIKSDVTNSDALIRQHCESVKNDVDIITDTQINELNKLRDAIFAKIDNYERECVSNATAESQLRTDMNTLIDDVSQFHARLHSYLENFDLDDDYVDAQINQARETFLKMNQKHVEYRSFLYRHRTLKFKAKETQLDETFLGTLVIEPEILNRLTGKSLRYLNLKHLCPARMDKISIHQLNQDDFVMFTMDLDHRFEMSVFNKKGLRIFTNFDANSVARQCNQFTTTNHVDKIFLQQFVDSDMATSSYPLYAIDRFQSVKKIKCDNFFISMSANRRALFCLAHNKIIVYDCELKLIKTIKLTNNVEKTVNVRNIDTNSKLKVSDNYLFLSNGLHMFIFGIDASEVELKFENKYKVDFRSFSILNDQMLVLNNDKMEIDYYDVNFNLRLKEQLMFDLYKRKLKLLDSMEDSSLFIDLKNLHLYYFQEDRDHDKNDLDNSKLDDYE